MDGFFPIFFLMVILKIPVAALLYLVWWAFHANTLPEEAPPEPEDHRFRRFRREPKRPRGPAPRRSRPRGAAAPGLPAGRPHPRAHAAGARPRLTPRRRH